jgi:hypothetical protein
VLLHHFGKWTYAFWDDYCHASFFVHICISLDSFLCLSWWFFLNQSLLGISISSWRRVRTMKKVDPVWVFYFFMMPSQSLEKGWPSLGVLFLHDAESKPWKRLTQFGCSLSSWRLCIVFVVWIFLNEIDTEENIFKRVGRLVKNHMHLGVLFGEFFILISPLSGLFASQTLFIWDITLPPNFQNKGILIILII